MAKQLNIRVANKVLSYGSFGTAVMRKLLHLHRLVSLVVAGFLCAAAVEGQIPRPTDRPEPKNPQEAQTTFSLPGDLKVELVACEPLIADPTDVAFDEHGRMWVCELHGWNLEGYLDIVELNKTGKLDLQVRRIPASPQARAEAHKQQYGTVKWLEDTDGDGRMDRAHIWADRLPPCYGLVPCRGGILVTCAPDIVFLADRDGDGRAEVREVLFTGFTASVLERAINNPRWGLDNWIYVATGGGGGTIRGPHLPSDKLIGHTDFRIRADGSALEPVTGRCGTFGLAMHDFGVRFDSTGGGPALLAIPLEYRYLARNPYIPAPDPTVPIAQYDRVFPISQPDPWRRRRSEDPNWVKFYGARETTPNGYFTGACGSLVYRAELLPETYRGNLFCCEPANNLVHRAVLERNGTRFSARRAPEDEQSEFLVSSDAWFRPVNLAMGPDGALYVVDMYREIIEDYSAIPRFLQQQYVDGLIAGHDRGRIWRIVPADSRRPEHHTPLRTALPAALTSADLVERLEHSNAWWRETAQRLLIERGDKRSVPALRDKVRNGSTPQSRLHALYALEGQGELDVETVIGALQDAHYAVRLHALRLAERWLMADTADGDRFVNRIVSMVNDPDAAVRLQLALTLGEAPIDKAGRALAHLAIHYGHEQWMSAAIASSSAKSAETLTELLWQQGEWTQGALEVLPLLAATVGAGGDTSALARLLHMVVDRSPIHDDSRRVAQGDVRIVVLDGLLEGIRRRSRHLEPDATLGQLILRLLSVDSQEVVDRGLQLAGHLGLKDSALLDSLWQKTLQQALDDALHLEQRMRAIRLLSEAPWQYQQKVGTLLSVQQTPQVQLAVIEMLGRSQKKEVAELLIQHVLDLSPQAQEAAVDALLARRDLRGRLLDGLEQDQIPLAALSSLRWAQLLDDEESDVRQRATNLWRRRAATDRRQVIEQYQPALSLKGNPENGKHVFQKQCAKCHRLGEVGQQVGPDLTEANNRPDSTLLADLLDPSAVIAPGYTTYVVTTGDGRIFTGILASETATSVTLRREQGVSDVILRKDIDHIRPVNRSLMPDGLERDLSQQEMADLISYLRAALGPPSPATVVLFDEEPEILEWLREGDGTAALEESGAFSGRIALRINPPQRFAARIPSWQFPIREHPASGEFRYLRFAWKAGQAEGVMLELAADGHWPPADKPLRRYYSGKNTTGWQAIQLSPTPPREWNVVTVDLWKDFGDFTLTGIAPTAMGGAALFDRIELLRAVELTK